MYTFDQKSLFLVLGTSHYTSNVRSRTPNSSFLDIENQISSLSDV